MTVEAAISPGVVVELGKTPETLPFAGKVILVTGASHENGIGAATAREFAREGARAVVITGREQSATRAEGVVKELVSLGAGESAFIPGDISLAPTSLELIQRIKADFNRLDVIVSNAGVTRDNSILDMSEEDWDIVMNTNLRPAWQLPHHAMVERTFPRKDGGAVILVGSIVGIYGNTGQENYAAAKAGLVGLTKTLAGTLGRRSIRVNGVFPGFVTTDITSGMTEEVIDMITKITPLGRLGTPEDIAPVIVFLASPKAAFMTGQVLEVDGGVDGRIGAIQPLIVAGYHK